MTWSVTAHAVMPARLRAEDAQRRATDAPCQPWAVFERDAAPAEAEAEAKADADATASSASYAVASTAAATWASRGPRQASTPRLAATTAIWALTTGPLSPGCMDARARISSREPHRGPKVKPAHGLAPRVAKGSITPGRDALCLLISLP
jgi:hypothetical protein